MENNTRAYKIDSSLRNMRGEIYDIKDLIFECLKKFELNEGTYARLASRVHHFIEIESNCLEEFALFFETEIKPRCLSKGLIALFFFVTLSTHIMKKTPKRR